MFLNGYIEEARLAAKLTNNHEGWSLSRKGLGWNRAIRPEKAFTSIWFFWIFRRFSCQTPFDIFKATSSMTKTNSFRIANHYSLNTGKTVPHSLAGGLAA